MDLSEGIRPQLQRLVVFRAKDKDDTNLSTGPCPQHQPLISFRDKRCTELSARLPSTAPTV